MGDIYHSQIVEIGAPKGNYDFNRVQFSFNNHNTTDNFPRQLILKTQENESFELKINFSKVEFNNPKKVMFKR